MSELAIVNGHSFSSCLLESNISTGRQINWWIDIDYKLIISEFK